MSQPFDERLKRLLVIRTGETRDASGNLEGKSYAEQTPFSTDSAEGTYNYDIATSQYTLGPNEVLARDVSNEYGIPNSVIEESMRVTNAHIKMLSDDPDKTYQGTASIMNAYAVTRLFGSKGGEYLVDVSSRRKYYEIDGDERGHYAKNPTTSNIIKWGSLDKYGRHSYQYQDFVFSKYWNIIPNNRMITLRRFTQPTYDNLNFPTMEEKNAPTTHPVATAVTYFGDGTDNTLSDLLNFSAEMTWKLDKGEVWKVTGEAPEMKTLNNAVEGWNKFASTGVINMATALGLVGHNVPGRGNENFDFRANQGLPPDPYENGPYENRILGPVNKINEVYQRSDEGLKFKMNNIKINFDYVGRPIGNINPKAALLDLLSNMLVMGYASGVWFGGAHRYMIDPTTYPFTDNESMQRLWKGKILGEDGATRSLVKNFKTKMATGLGSGDGDNALGGMKNIFSTMLAGASSLMADLMGAIGFDGAKDWLKGKQKNMKNGDKGENLANNVEEMVASTIQGRMGAIKYLHNMRALLTGEPVGDWHLVIGNPMNPIVEIGNLICKEISIKFTDELGQDDFPIGFRATITLEHGIGRDRDGIESMFNKGAGRIYELPDKYASSADGQTIVDAATKTVGKGTYGSEWAIGAGQTVVAKSRWGVTGTIQERIINDTVNKVIGTPGFVENSVYLRSELRNTVGLTYHPIMPWQTKIVL